MVLVVVKKRGAASEQVIPFEDQSAQQVTVKQLKAEIAAKFKRLTTLDKKVLDDNAQTLDFYGVESTTIDVKDMGPQISYRGVFFVEYMGPLLIHPLLYAFEPRFFPERYEYSKMQKIAYTLVMLHFVKRELETFFVHRFSHATMPFKKVFINSGHYWILSGIAIAAPLYGPWHSKQALAGTIRDNDTFLYSCVAAWALAETLNFWMHTKTAALRSSDSKTRSIPQGFGFNLVSFPNYLFEILGWVSFCVLTNELAAAGFTIISTLTMVKWALEKHRKYRKEFGSKYPKGRKAIFPFIL